jgi:hypothetical protein
VGSATGVSFMELGNDEKPRRVVECDRLGIAVPAVKTAAIIAALLICIFMSVPYAALAQGLFEANDLSKRAIRRRAPDCGSFRRLAHGSHKACRRSEEAHTLRLAMTSYNPTNMAQVHTALARIAADVAVEGLPLRELPGARTVGDLRTLREWPHGLRLVVESRDFVVRVERIRPS